MTLLFLIGTTQFAVQWLLTTQGTHDGNASAYLALFDYPVWTHIVIDATSMFMFIVADGLVTWRCYHVWDRSYRIILLPLFFIVAEVGIAISSVIYIIIVTVDSRPTGTQVNIINDLQSTVFFVSLAASLTTTVLVAYRIHSTARSASMSDVSFSTSRSRFRHIIDIVVQSAAVYSLVLLVAAVSGVLPTVGSFPDPAGFALAEYSSCLLVPVAGMAPTVMVARVSLASARTNGDHAFSLSSQDTGDMLSNLGFERHGRSTYYTETHVDPILTVDPDDYRFDPVHAVNKDSTNV